MTEDEIVVSVLAVVFGETFTSFAVAAARLIIEEAEKFEDTASVALPVEDDEFVVLALFKAV